MIDFKTLLLSTYKNSILTFFLLLFNKGFYQIAYLDYKKRHM